MTQAYENANRTLRRLESEAAANARQAKAARDLKRAAKANLDLFQEQCRAGQRQVMDVVGVYETFATRQDVETTLRFEVLRLQIELARVQGVLVDGDRI